jgi:hypothetical protein
MNGIHRFSERMIDYAERMSDVADAAQGRNPRRSGARRWLLLPASGAALYALVRSDSFSKQAKGLVDEAKTRASDLPEDLMSRVRQTAPTTTTSTNGGRRRRSSSTSPRRATRKTTASR